MNEVILTRRDPARNLHRYYRLDVQPDLFGAWCLIREWGRIGQGGRRRSTPFPTASQAQVALERKRRRKERRLWVMRKLVSQAMKKAALRVAQGGFSSSLRAVIGFPTCTARAD